MIDALVWIDCEMTGLDVAHDALIEVAVQVTDGNLNPLGEGIDIVISAPEETLDSMGDFVRDMHTNSGLLDEVRASQVTLREAEQQVLAYVKSVVPTAGKAPIAGNTIGTDRTFLARYMPELESYLHYRSIDVSSIKELAKRWYPKVFYAAPSKHGNHRALADIMESIAELAYYRATVFVAPPGPTTEEAQAVAAAQTRG
ncbi:MAG: oligoribonuclease [Propionibacteriaceae bacterium]|nr:oligoribonuclease [Propionibacteriaceae bacterium]